MDFAGGSFSSDMMLRLPLVFALILALSRPALAADWFVISSDRTQCVDLTTSETASGSPQLGTPDGTAALYQSLGDVVGTGSVKDGAGAAIIVMHVKDAEGNHILDLTFFPSLADCQFVLSYSQRNHLRLN